MSHVEMCSTIFVLCQFVLQCVSSVFFFLLLPSGQFTEEEPDDGFASYLQSFA